MILKAYKDAVNSGNFCDMWSQFLAEKCMVGYTISGNNIIINNRIYGVKNEGNTLFPRSGGAPEFIDLTQGQIKAIQLMKKVPAERLNQALKGAGISSRDINFAKDFIKNTKEMNNYICYLKGVKQDKLIINLLAKIFRCNEETITDLLENETTQIKFENKVLDNVSEFQTELNVYIDGDIKTVFLNNLLFGIEISKHLGEEVIVNSNFNDPYQWILIKNDLFFLSMKLIMTRMVFL